MKKTQCILVVVFFLVNVLSAHGRGIGEVKRKIASFPIAEMPMQNASFDWLIHPEKAKAKIYRTADNKSVILSNGLVSRVFRIEPNLATVDIINQMTGETMLRAVSSEGNVTIDGKVYSLGGLQGQPERGYLKMEWLDNMTSIPQSFVIENIEVGEIPATFQWTASRWALNKKMPTGKRVTFVMRAPDAINKVVAKLNYDIYDELPLIRKGMELINEGDVPFNLDEFHLEKLAFAEPESLGGGNPTIFLHPNISIESNFALAGAFTEKETEVTEKWVTDSTYTSQCNYLLQTPCVLDVSLPIGPDILVSKQEPFVSNDVYEMPYDSYDRERQGLFKRRMYAKVAPWTTENPIFLHLTSSKWEEMKNAVDQCVETGYEMIILSFGCGLDMENTKEENYQKFKEITDYAHSKGIEIGGYSLLASRWISDDVDVINPETGKRGGMKFGSSPCLCSDWGYNYFDKIKTFFEKTGMKVFEHDGSYPGDVCASTTHAHHKGLKDSQWKQYKKITQLYKWMRENDIYLNVPDYYFLNGSSKTGIGYRETNWSLPRDRQLIHGRQVNYNGTWDRMASSCWTFVPLVEYQGGGAAATLEPLSEHLDAYQAHMIQNYGAGIQACYRGPRLYDTTKTKEMVTDVIAWYKKYRTILNSDIIHLRKPDGKDWDGFLHVNPKENNKGMALFFNPTDKVMTRTVKLPLYYTGLTKEALIAERGVKAKRYKLNRDYSVDIVITIPANGSTWLLIN